MLASLLFLPHAGLVRALDLGMGKAHVHYLLPKSRVKDHLDAARKPRVLVRMVKYHTPFIGTMTLLTLRMLSISFLILILTTTSSYFIALISCLSVLTGVSVYLHTTPLSGES